MDSFSASFWVTSCSYFTYIGIRSSKLVTIFSSIKSSIPFWSMSLDQCFHHGSLSSILLNVLFSMVDLWTRARLDIEEVNKMKIKQRTISTDFRIKHTLFTVFFHNRFFRLSITSIVWAYIYFLW